MMGPRSGMDKNRIRDNIPDPQHCQLSMSKCLEFIDAFLSKNQNPQFCRAVNPDPTIRFIPNPEPTKSDPLKLGQVK